jgi:hypothetical protein
MTHSENVIAPSRYVFTISQWGKSKKNGTNVASIIILTLPTILKQEFN